MNLLTSKQENHKMLAALLGINETEAAERLNVDALVTAGKGESKARTVAFVETMLNRTVRATQIAAHGATPAVEVVIGNAQPRGGAPVVVWVGSTVSGIRVSREPFVPLPLTFHPIFELIAACYVCGMALRYAVGEGGLAGDDLILISPAELLGRDLSVISKRCDVSKGVLAGAGAVGNGFLYGLQLFDVAGTLDVVDPKKVHDGILNRCVWFAASEDGENKAAAIARAAQGSFPNLKLVPHDATLAEYRKTQDASEPWALISGVDSRRARRSLQRELPQDVFDASTTGIEEVVLHFNRLPTAHACLSCTYPQDEGEIKHEAHVAEALGVPVELVRQEFVSVEAAVLLCENFPDLMLEQVLGKAYDSLFKARCAEGKLLTTSDRQVLAPFCFVSVLAGAFLALEFVRRLNSRNVIEPFNFWRLSPWRAPVLEARDTRGQRPDCDFCADATLSKVANELYGETVTV